MAVASWLLFSAQQAAAEVTFAGQGTVGGTTFAATQTAGTFETGGTTGEIIVGISAPSAGGLFIDGTAPTPDPLVTSSAILGQGAGSVGAVDLADLASLWDITGTLTVGSAGQGQIDITNAAAVNAVTTVIGDLAGSNGFVNATGLGSRFLTGALSVGNSGNGTLNIGDTGFGVATATSVGAQGGGHGFISVDGQGSSFTAGIFTVGDAGNGTVNLSTAASLNAGTTVVGSTDNVQGFVGITDQGTSFVAGTLIVGDAGVGQFEVEAGAFLQTTGEAMIGSTIESGDGRVLVSGEGSQWTSTGNLTIGGLAGLSHGRLQLANQAVAQVFGALTVNNRGRVELSGGTLRMRPQVANQIVNNGVIVGGGFIDGGLDIGVTGELRNAAGLANVREYLLVSEVVNNSGLIESLGGEMEFEQLVTNLPGADIVARDAVMRFRDSDAGTLGGPDLVNSGVLTLGGNTTLHGDISTLGSGKMLLLQNSELLIEGDITFTASAILGLSVGEDAATLDVTGMADLSNAIISLDYFSPLASQPGDSYTILEAAGGVLPTGFPTRSASADGRLWDIDLVGTDTLIATATAAITTPMGSDFNGDGVVDRLDIIIWQNNYPSAGGATNDLGDSDNDGDVDGSDFLKIQRELGLPPTFPLVAAATAVPEPSTLALALLTLVCCPRRRRHCRTPLRVV